MTYLRNLIVASCAILAMPALAHDYSIGDLTIEHPFSFATPPGSATAAGYMEITNNGTEDDVLVSAASSFPMTQLHKTEMTDGIMKMRHQMGGVPVPAGETVAFQPGGLHVMFMGLDSHLTEGEENTVTLTFENAGTIDVTFNVEKRGKSKDAMKKGEMTHDDHDMKGHEGH